MCAVVVSVLLQGAAFARQGPAAAELQLGKPVEREIAPGQVHSYALRLDAGAFVRAVVDQRGVDLVVRVVGPDGASLAEVDSPNGEWGPEPVKIETRAAGLYRLEVRPLDERASTGRYEVLLATVRPLATTAEGKLDEIFDEWNRADAPGVAVSVVRDGKVIYERGLGAANLEYDVPVTPSTVFHVASVSKQFTALAVLLLARDGKLSLDDDIRKHLPEIPDLGRTITIRHLLTHTSGLYDQWEALAMAGWRQDDVVTTEHILRLVSHERRLNFEPGTRLLYCNTGFTLAAEIVARVSGRSFREYTQQAIFAPLGMSSTHFHDDHELIVRNRAYSYASTPGGFRLSALNFATVGATSLFTTSSDLVKWLDNFRTARVGGEDLLRQMQTSTVLSNGERVPYGLGVELGEHRGARRVSHGGADAGYRSYVVWFPDSRLGVAVASNLASANPGWLAYRVADLYLGEASAPAARPAAAVAPVTVDSKLLAEYAGTYRVEPAQLMRVTLEDGKLMAQPPEAPKLVLEPRSDTTFLMLGPGLEVTFERDASGRVRGLRFRGETAVRAEPVAPDAAALAEYAGVYYSDELGATYTVSVEKDRLVATHRRTGAVTLAPVIRDEFLGNRWYFRGVEFVRDSRGRVSGLRVTGGRVKGIAFERMAETNSPPTRALPHPVLRSERVRGDPGATAPTPTSVPGATAPTPTSVPGAVAPGSGARR